MKNNWDEKLEVAAAVVMVMVMAMMFMSLSMIVVILQRGVFLLRVLFRVCHPLCYPPLSGGLCTRTLLQAPPGADPETGPGIGPNFRRRRLRSP